MDEIEAKLWSDYNAARNAVFEHYVSMIRTCIAKFVADHKNIDFDDAFSAASIRVLVRAIPGFNKDRSTPKTWISMHVTAAMKDMIRNGSTPNTVTANLDNTTDLRLSGECLEDFESRIGNLSEGSKQILRMRYIYGYTQTEIARKLGVCKATISKKMQKMRAVLQKKCTK